MNMIAVHDREQIQHFLNQRDPANFVYFCNNLEEGFWENTQWFGLGNDEEILAMAMLILKYETPVLLASCYDENNGHQKELMNQLLPYLPNKLYSHLDLHTAKDVFAPRNDLQITPFMNMKLSLADRNDYDASDVQQLGAHEMASILTFLEESHPDYLLDEEFVERGYYFGIKEKDTLISLAGVVAESGKYGVAAIGNVSTHPSYRRKNLASRTISALVHFLLPKYPHITLNVKAANEPAIHCYQKLGFIEIGRFEEAILP